VTREALAGLRAFVLGGTRGIGRAICVELAGAGADVAAGYASRDETAEETRALIETAGGRCTLIRGDAGEDPAALVHQAAAELGALDAFVACAVTPVRRSILELEPEDFERTMRVNAAPFIFGAVAAATHMDDGGRIVGISSTGTHRPRNLAYAPLALAKGAVEAGARFLAAELAPRRITVNVIAPGPTDTEAFDAMAEDPAALKQRLAARTPMGRLSEPADAARLVAFLCSPAADWVTGQLVFSDGGYSLL
jgi:NAD(P)-dependent dehydrogenase (short-subunit alcohol dehydrogenase family)